ncbi:MAG: hypothetical protein PHR43_05790 [Dehalococcoidales bacterium]|nr:hypothetical protein [Dehalococcoidales bacterium]
MAKTGPGRGPQISKEVRRLIINEAIHDSRNMPRRALAVRLEDLIEKMGEVSPTEDTLAKMISEARNQQPSELDQPWCVGACAKYSISPDIVPVLMKMKKLRATEGAIGKLGTITIREAQWVARLYPAAEPVISVLTSDDNGRLWWLSVIVNGYVLRERVSEQMNEQYPNTSDLDSLYFANENPFSDASLNAWWSKIPTEYRQAVLDAVEQERSVNHEDIKRHKGRTLSEEEVRMINDCFDAMKSGGLNALNEFVKQSPLAQENGMIQIILAILYSKAVWRESNDRQINKTQG